MTEFSKETLIGYVTDVQAGMLNVTLNDSNQDGPLIVTIGDEDVLIGSVGSYVAVVHRNAPTLTMVTRMSEKEKLVPLEPGQSGYDLIRVAQVSRELCITPLGTLDASGEFQRGVSIFPTTGAEVHALSSTVIGRMFNRFQKKNMKSVICLLPQPKKFILIQLVFSGGILQSLGKRVRGNRTRLQICYNVP